MPNAGLALTALMMLLTDAPIPSLLPDVRWHPEVRVQELTLASFLAHTHGIESGPIVTSAASTGVFTEDHFAKLLTYRRPRSSRALAYSNVGYNIASMVIGATSFSARLTPVRAARKDAATP